MKLYVCWNTSESTPIIGPHPCGQAHKVLVEAGYAPEVVKARGIARLPEFPINKTAGRQEVKRLTGKLEVPVLVLDDGTAIGGSKEIVEWAKANPVTAAAS